MKSYGVTIHLTDDSKIDLIDILKVIGEKGKDLSWSISHLDCLGENSEVLHKISDQNKQISGSKFYQLFSHIHQTIEGDFVGFENNSINALITIKAIDGSEFDVETNDTEILKNIRNNFENVIDLIY